jgi:hypothetical protein
MAEHEWKKAFRVFTEYALSNSAIDDACPPYNILSIHKHLLRLIEACHLLEVRSNIKKTESREKKKVKKQNANYK